MVKEKSEKTETQKRADAARVAFQKAKDANEKTDNASTKKSLEEARTTLQAAVKAENRERFISVGNSRTKKARAAIRQLVKVANPKNYSFSQEEGSKIVAALTEAVNDVSKAFANAGKGGGAASGDNFSL